ncbi:PREDICTED: uncharacterized protein LOC109590034 [Amphimedon queenslandica]|uniref:BPTI/Kunitz inhibitor domain-containing protein n=1 Tax=Amphimedon queenslandica TaxID=400682 RepID=A0AAN0JWJ6_AMPQE|nr:PREDICTED: uncharacterized protein LOC109590034 [Amphimedon queenslandica]|eukprot:XP_019861557.1 PREDICTED: uncharacterized protein LOC109590034 [Amphimedon queenslandica]
MMTAAIVLLCVLPLAASLSSTDKCSGTYYRPHDSCEHLAYTKYYYDSFQGSCKFFVYRECIYKPHSNVTNGYGNPHNTFDRLRDCQDTCFPVRDNLSTSCSITTSKTSSLHTATETQSATESVSLSTSSPLMMSSSPVMIISSIVSGMSPIGFMPTSTLMLNPTQSLTVSVGRASTDDGGLSFVGTSTDTGPQLSIIL